MSIDSQDITGLVLAGGQGTRMGGADKGLQLHQGRPLALHALLRLQPQVGRVMVNANRNLSAYQAMGAPVWPDALPDTALDALQKSAPDFPGPLAGLLAGLEHCRTPYLVTVPCDTPHFPADLVARLAQGLVNAQAEVAMAVTLESGQTRAQPVFALVGAGLLQSLQAYLQRGERRITGWMHQQRCVDVPFNDAAAFFNVNTLADLQQLQQPQQPQQPQP